jgi:phosphoglycolate phosphatase
MKIEMVLFDVDGTLVDTAGAGRFALQNAFIATFGVDAVTSAENNRAVRFAGMTDPAIIEALATAGGVLPERLGEHYTSLVATFYTLLESEMKRLDGKARVLPGVTALLEQLDNMKTIRTGLITGNMEDGARIKLEPFDLNRFFASGGFGSDHHDRREVARIGVGKMCELYRLRVQPEQVVIIGDTEKDVDCARANGYRSIAVQFDWVSKRRLMASKPDIYLENLSNLAACLEAIGV